MKRHPNAGTHQLKLFALENAMMNEGLTFTELAEAMATRTNRAAACENLGRLFDRARRGEAHQRGTVGRLAKILGVEIEDIAREVEQ